MNHKPLICVSVIRKTVTDCLEVINRLNDESVDLIELRLDYLSPFPDYTQLKNLFTIKKPKIITIRSKKEGGKLNLPESERIKIIDKVLKEKIEYIDLEYSLKNVKKRIIAAQDNNVKIILSYHDFNQTPSLNELKNKFQKMKQLKPDIIKIATYVNSTKDVFTLLNLLDYGVESNSNVTIIGMGEKGKVTRILNPLLGSKIIYCSLPSEPAAPGQLDYKKTLEILNELV
ncbi:MAG: type I 3-dehydroquinate dehydratase [Candidatus Odinarchaeia archaeon]